MAKKQAKTELDWVYIVKILVYLLLGAQWVRISRSSGSTEVPLPIGALIGLILIRFERFTIDRKIEYAVLLGAMFIGFWLPVGLTIIL